MAKRIQLENTTIGQAQVFSYLGNKQYNCLCLSCGKEYISLAETLLNGPPRVHGCQECASKFQRAINRERCIERNKKNKKKEKDLVPTSLASRLRSSSSGKKWKMAVLEKDNNQCIVCKTSHKLVAHHLVRFSIILKIFGIQSVDEAYLCESLWDIGNGVTLCKLCHKVVHKSKNEPKLECRIERSRISSMVEKLRISLQETIFYRSLSEEHQFLMRYGGLSETPSFTYYNVLVAQILIARGEKVPPNCLKPQKSLPLREKITSP